MKVVNLHSPISIPPSFYPPYTMNDYFLLIRHAPTAVDAARPSASWGLTEAGEASCRLLAEQMAPLKPTAVFTSHEPKAQQTGQAVAERLGIGWQTAVNLHEHDRSNVTYLSHDQFQANVTRLFTDPDALFFGRESGSQARQRFTQAIQTILAAHPHDTPAIVSHGTVITLFLSHYNPIDPIPFWQALPMPCLMVVEREGFRLKTASFL